MGKSEGKRMLEEAKGVLEICLIVRLSLIFQILVDSVAFCNNCKIELILFKFYLPLCLWSLKSIE